MSPQDKAKNTNGAEPGELPLTPPELKLFSIIVKHLPKSFEVDWDKVAADAGMKSGDVAKTRLRQIRTKYGIYGPEGVPAARGNAGKADASKALKPQNGAHRVTKPRTPSKAKSVKAVSVPVGLEQYPDFKKSEEEDFKVQNDEI